MNRNVLIELARIELIEQAQEELPTRPNFSGEATQALTAMLMSEMGEQYPYVMEYIERSEEHTGPFHIEEGVRIALSSNPPIPASDSWETVLDEVRKSLIIALPYTGLYSDSNIELKRVNELLKEQPTDEENTDNFNYEILTTEILKELRFSYYA